jgi:hypothetical protein
MLSARWILAPVAGAVLCGCGAAAAAANTKDPVSTVEGYMQAVSGGDAAAEAPYLETNINDGIPLTGPTSASRYMASHKGAKWRVVAVPWVDPATKAPVTTKKACTVSPPQGGQLCIVTVEVASGDSKVWFHFDVEDRYTPGSWLIVGVTEVTTRPDDLLPNGNEAHSG